LASSGNWNTILGNGATSGNDGYDENVDYTLTWQITRNASDGLDFDVKMEGGTLDNDGIAQVTVTDPTPVGNDEITGPFGSFSFDTFAVRPSSGGTLLTADTFDTKLFKVEFTTSAVPPGTNGDFNNDSKVDAGDYVTWRKNNGTNNALANDSNLGTPIGPNHYTLWRSNFGNPPGAGGGLQGAAVPEPNTLMLILGGMIGALRVRRRS
jgi:hypothetical protein